MQWRVSEMALYNNSDKKSIFFAPNTNFSLVLKFVDVALLINIVGSLLLEYKVVFIID
jgi:hypothetical protein